MYRENLAGGIVALDSGLGKTIIVLAIIATLRLVELNRREVENEWKAVAREQGVAMHSLHNPQGGMGPCPSGNPWGLECCRKA